MNVQLPEEPKYIKPKSAPVPLTPDQQLQMLRDKLAGHAAFGRCRAQFSSVPMHSFINRAKPPEPTKSLDAFADWYADRKVMLNMLTQLKRDGHMVAFEELDKALNANHVIIGEDVPLEKTEPGIAIVFDIDRVVLMAHWLYSAGCDSSLGIYEHPRGPYRESAEKAFPELAREFNEKQDGPLEFPATIFGDRLEDALERLASIKPDEPDGFCAKHYLCFDMRSILQHYRFGSVAMGIFIKNVTQDQVLSKFTREEQESMTTWRFDYPKAKRHDLDRIWEHGHSTWIGFHPESEHEIWRKQWPAFVSRNPVHGLGAIILKDEMVKHEVVRPYISQEWMHSELVKDGRKEPTERIAFGFSFEKKG